MALLFSKYTRGALRTPVPDIGGAASALRFKHTLTVAQNVGANILDLGILPANCRVVDAILSTDDLDSSTGMVVDIGLMSGSPGEALDADGNARTCGDELFDGITTMQSGGVLRTTEKDAFNIAAVAYDRSIGLKIATVATTPVEGDIEVIVFVSSSG
jgi:hypothetical protein